MAIYDYNLTTVDSTSRTSLRSVLAGWNSTDGAVIVQTYNSGSNWTLDVRTTSDPQTTAPSSEATVSVTSSSTNPNFAFVGAAINGRTVYAVVGEGPTGDKYGYISWTFSLWSCDLSAGTPSWTEEDSNITGTAVSSALPHEYTNSVVWNSTDSELWFLLPATDGGNMSQQVLNADRWSWTSGGGSVDEGYATLEASVTAGVGAVFGEAAHVNSGGARSYTLLTLNEIGGVQNHLTFEADNSTFSAADTGLDSNTDPQYTSTGSTIGTAFSLVVASNTVYALAGYDNGTNNTLWLQHRTVNTTTTSSGEFDGNIWVSEAFNDNTNLDLASSAVESAFSAVGGFDSQGDLHVFVIDDTSDDVEVWKYDVGADSWDSTPTVVYSTTGANGAGWIYDGGGRTYTRTSGSTVYCGFLLYDTTLTNNVGLLEVVIEAGGTNYPESLTDAAKAGETLSEKIGAGESLTDDAKAGELLETSASFGVTLTDDVKAGETLVGDTSAGVSDSITDAAKAGEVIETSASFGVASTDAAKAGENIVVETSGGKSIVDSAKAGEVLATEMAYKDSITDSAKAGETVVGSTTGAFSDSITDAAKAGETLAIEAGFTDSITDAAKAGELLSYEGTEHYSDSITDAAVAGESISVYSTADVIPEPGEYVRLVTLKYVIEG